MVSIHMSALAASQIFLHLNWRTHSNYPQLRGETERFVHNFIADRCIHTPGVLFEAIGGTDDHIHLALRLESQVQVSELVGDLKNSSSNEANTRFGANAIQWQRGFGVVRFSEKQLGWVLSYIRNQREHHARGKVFSKLETSPTDSGDARRVQDSSGLFAHVEDDVPNIPVLDESDIQPALSSDALERAQAAAVFQEVQAQSIHAAPASSDDPAYALQVRAKDLLSLAETDRRSAEIAFKDLGFEKQLDTALALQGDELHEWLQLAEDFTELVRALPPEHLHQAVRLIGDEDALNLLQAASSEQMQQLTDIEWFTEGRLDRKKVRHWLNLLMTLDEDEADQAMQGLDVNALAQYLRPSVRFAVDKDNLLLALHLNQRYLFTPDDIDPRDDFTRNLLDYFYAVDRDLFGDVIALLIGEDAETVENDMYGGREDRLIKRGFPAQSQAEFLLELVNASNYGIEWPKLESPLPARGESSGVGLKTVEGSNALQTPNRARTPFLLTALAWGRATKMLGERTEREFIKESADLANSLLLAHTKDSGKPELRSSSLLAVQVLTSVALEALTGPLFVRGSDTQMSVAADKLKMMELRELFQIGWSLTREVARDAWALAFDERIDELRLPRNLKWLPPGLRKDLRDAEDLMSWKRVAATASETAPPAGDDDKNPSQELLTWPRLCRLRHSVWLAQNELARRFSEKNGESEPVHE